MVSITWISEHTKRELPFAKEQARARVAPSMIGKKKYAGIFAVDVPS
jgi:hypothetical protein